MSKPRFQSAGRPAPRPRPQQALALLLGLICAVGAVLVPALPATATPPDVAPSVTVSSLSASKGPTAGGTAVTATGTGFETSWTRVLGAGTGWHAVGLATDGRLYGWGSNGRGQLGSGGPETSVRPVPVTLEGTPLEGKEIVQVATGYHQTLAVDSDGRVYVWGRTNLLAADGTNQETAVPVELRTAGTPMAGKKIVAVSAGTSYSLALDADGALYGWGANQLGQLATGTTDYVPAPIAIPTEGTPIEGKRIVTMAAGNLHTAAVDSDGQVYAWGFNQRGELGNGRNDTALTPVAVRTAGTAMDGKHVTQVAVGMMQTIALTSDGTLYAWGSNFNDEAGIGESIMTSVPMPVATEGTPLAGKKFTMIRAAGLRSGAVDSDGRVYMWGENAVGQLGNGHSGRVRAPGAVATDGTPMAGKRIVEMFIGNSRTIVLDSEGVAYAWGSNYDNALGASAGTAERPVLVNALPETASIVFGEDPGTGTVRNGSTEITGETPPHAAGSVDVTVTANGRSVTLPGAFTYQDVPDAPGNLVAVPGLESPETTGTVTWELPEYAGASAVTSFAVRYRETGATTWSSADPELPADLTSADLSGLAPDTSYEIEVSASNDSGASVAATAALTTDPDTVLASLSLAPQAVSIEQGDSVTFTATGANAAGDPLPVDMADVRLSSDAAGDTGDGATLTFPTSGTRRITAETAGVSATADVVVSPRYSVTWNENWPDAGPPATEVVSSEQLSELPDPSAAGWVIAEWNTRADGSGDTVDLDTELASVATGPELTLYAIWERRTVELGLSADSAVSGESVTVTATANAPFRGTADVTAEAVLGSTESTDTFDAATLFVSSAGTRTVTAEFDGVTASASLRVTAGPLDSLSLSAPSATVARGGSMDFEVSGADAAGNAVEIDPTAVVLRSDVSTDVVRGLTVTFPTASPHVITAAVDGIEASVRIEVRPDAAPPTPGKTTELGATGSPTGWGVAGAALALVAAGAVLVLWRRHRRPVA